MVLARLGKLNPHELIGPAPSKPPRVDQSQFQAEEDDDSSSSSSSSSSPDEEEEAVDTGAETDKQDQKPAAVVVDRAKEEIVFFDSVQPQARTFQEQYHDSKEIHIVQAGPFAGARGMSEMDEVVAVLVSAINSVSFYLSSVQARCIPWRLQAISFCTRTMGVSRRDMNRKSKRQTLDYLGVDRIREPDSLPKIRKSLSRVSSGICCTLI